MVLVCLKSFLWPASRTGERQKLLDVERRPSTTTDCTVANGIPADFDDKTSTSQGHASFLRCRVNPRIISDATIGLSDGLTVPFALTAGLSALGTTKLVVLAGFAELAAGAVSMGLGGYLGAKGEADGYHAALQETKDMVRDDEQRACSMAVATLEKHNFSAATLNGVTADLLAQPEELVDFLMRFHHHLTEASFTGSRPYVSALTIAVGYIVGGLVPLLPYLFFNNVQEALYCSAAVMAFALFVFGWVKTVLVGECSRWVCFQKAVEMLVFGLVAAVVAMGFVRVIGG